MTYGVYTRDLSGVSMSGQSLETARKYCYGDYVVCEERDKTFGFELHVMWHKWFFRVSLPFRYAHLGFIGFSWAKIKCKAPARIVEAEGGAP